MAKAGGSIKVSGKKLLLAMLAGVIVVAVALYVVLIPMHFEGSERLQEEHRQDQVDEEAAGN